MPEGSKDATILIAISWQALKRAKKQDLGTMVSDCVVVVVFAGFFIEANLNIIIEGMNKTKEMESFLGKRPGLLSKLAWFYNFFIAEVKVEGKKQFKDDFEMIKKGLYMRFPSFVIISEFRNKIAHGVIDTSIANLDNVEKLRDQAKIIVDDLYKTAQDNGYLIPRNIFYDEAIGFNSSDTQKKFQNFSPDRSS